MKVRVTSIHPLDAHYQDEDIIKTLEFTVAVMYKGTVQIHPLLIQNSVWSGMILILDDTIYVFYAVQYEFIFEDEQED